MGLAGSVRFSLNLPRTYAERSTTTPGPQALIETLDQAGTKVSRPTNERVLHRGGLHGRRPRKTPLLRKEHLEARQQAFARGHLKQNPSFRSTILWSDETKLELLGHMGAEYVWRKKGKAHKPKNTMPTIKHGGGNIILWDTSLPVAQGTSSRSKES